MFGLFENKQGKALVAETLRTIEHADLLSAKDKNKVAKNVFTKIIKAINEIDGVPLGPKLDKIMQTQDVSIGIGVPIVADDHEMMGVVYRFNSMEHWGKAVDAMVENQEFVSIVEKANSLGTLKSSRILVSM